VLASAFLGLYWPGDLVQATTNGGTTWHSSLSDPSGIWGLDFASATVGWAVGLSNLYTTANGGQSWNLEGEPSRPLVTVDFFNASSGYGITTTGGLELSTDGGKTWQASSFTQAVTSECFTTAEAGYVATEAGGFIDATSNGGASWTQSYGLPFPIAPPGEVSTDLACQGSTVWALSDFGNTFGQANSSSYAVSLTLNGGRSWAMLGDNVAGSPPSVPGQTIPVPTPMTILTTGPSSATIIGYGGSAAQVVTATTSDGGASFVKASAPVPLATAANVPPTGLMAIDGAAQSGTKHLWLLLAVAASDPTTYNSVVLASTDGGQAWATVSQLAFPVAG